MFWVYMMMRSHSHFFLDHNSLASYDGRNITKCENSSRRLEYRVRIYALSGFGQDALWPSGWVRHKAGRAGPKLSENMLSRVRTTSPKILGIKFFWWWTTSCQSPCWYIHTCDHTPWLTNISAGHNIKLHEPRKDILVSCKNMRIVPNFSNIHPRNVSVL
jgi:hypothetical protein